MPLVVITDKGKFVSSALETSPTVLRGLLGTQCQSSGFTYVIYKV
jgi:hypothetical protein